MNNKVVLITGGATGIGKETTIEFAKNNLSIYINKLDAFTLCDF